MAARFFYAVRPWMVIVGRDFEMADMSNPNGDIVGERYQVFGQDAEGYRFLFNHNFTDVQEAERFANSMADDDASRAVGFVEIDPSYGSVAYQREGIEYQRWCDEYDTGRWAA